jgi:hypothetical protein
VQCLLDPRTDGACRRVLDHLGRLDCCLQGIWVVVKGTGWERHHVIACWITAARHPDAVSFASATGSEKWA